VTASCTYARKSTGLNGVDISVKLAKVLKVTVSELVE
jgi:hypothetical protein